MHPVATLIFILILFFDIRILKNKSKKEFFSIFNIQKWIFLLFVLMCGLFFYLNIVGIDFVNVFILLFVFYLYVSKRAQFLKSFTEDKRLQLTANGMGVVLYWIFGTILFATSLYQINIFHEGLFEELEEMVLSAGFSSYLLVVLIKHNSRIFCRGDFWQNIGFRKEETSYVLKFILPAFLGFAMAYFSAIIITERGVHPETPLSIVLERTQSPWLIPAFIILALVIAPLVEEITFRGYFFEVLKRLKGQRFAFYIISLTFGTLHVAQYWGDWAAISVVMIMGFILTFVRIISQTTAASVCTHYFYNIGVVVIVTILEMAKGNL